MNRASTISTTNSRIIATAEQLQNRVRELGQQVSKDYAGKTVYAVCVLENGFVFMADLVRAITVPVVCQFVKPYVSELTENNISTTEILYSPDVDVSGKDVLLVEGVLHSGITSEFLIRNFLSRGAASVRLAVIIDRPSQRRVSLNADYAGFQVGDDFAFGYGLGTPELDRNAPALSSVAVDWAPIGV